MTEPILLKNPPRVIAEAAVVGSKEAEGPLGEKFDYRDTSDLFGKPTYEQAESEMQHIAMNLALHKRKLHPEDIDLLLAGDLMNQCTASAYGLHSFRLPYLGLYGACSTSAEGLCLGAMLLSGGLCDRLGVVVSSHYASAERQFRFPLEYGAQRAPTAQWTVTGSGAFLLQASAGSPADPTIPDILPGRILSAGITDLNNMGAAMAPAACDTLKRYFTATGTKPSDYDRIFTGDLGAEGHAIVVELLGAEGYDMTGNYDDCGLLIFDRKKQDMHAGGSGCGCSASVLAAEILPALRTGRLQNVLFLATGALMSPASVEQGSGIPGIAHLVHFMGGNL